MNSPSNASDFRAGRLPRRFWSARPDALCREGGSCPSRQMQINCNVNYRSRMVAPGKRPIAGSAGAKAGQRSYCRRLPNNWMGPSLSLGQANFSFGGLTRPSRALKSMLPKNQVKTNFAEKNRPP
jgi:hypothetical protein